MGAQAQGAVGAMQGSAKPEAKPSVPFSGSGHTLSGKKPVETIKMD